jgi:GTP-sensing pleiotropic transcriptional regulator CodY
MTLVYDPTAPRRVVAAEAGATLATLSGKVVGFIDNAKPNFDHLVVALAERLIADYGVKRVVKRRKTSASIPAPQEIVRELAEECDLVITGSGD